MKIGLITYPMANVKSVSNAVEYFGCQIVSISNSSEWDSYDGLVIPGVGAFGPAVNYLKREGLFEILRKLLQKDEIPVLGICLGMQLLADSSFENGKNEGLSIISGQVKKISVGSNLCLPHIGWNSVYEQDDSVLFEGLRNPSNFYFSHTYNFLCPEIYITSAVSYGHRIVASIRKGKIFGVQFHPERSGRNGKQLINNFLNFVKKDSEKR